MVPATGCSRSNTKRSPDCSSSFFIRFNCLRLRNNPRSHSGIWSVGQWVIYIGHGTCHMPTFDIFGTIHAHPTLDEAHEAENVFGAAPKCQMSACGMSHVQCK